MMQQIYQAILDHKAALAVGSGWFIHVFWPDIVKIYPRVVAKGGVLRLARDFFWVPASKSVLANPSVIAPPSDKGSESVSLSSLKN